MLDTRSITIRLARSEDAAALGRLADLDAAPVPQAPALLAFLDGEPAAALSLTDGHVVADPFLPSGSAVALLRRRAAGLRSPAAQRPRLARRVRPRVAV